MAVALLIVLITVMVFTYCNLNGEKDKFDSNHIGECKSGYTFGKQASELRYDVWPNGWHMADDQNKELSSKQENMQKSERYENKFALDENYDITPMSAGNYQDTEFCNSSGKGYPADGAGCLVNNKCGTKCKGLNGGECDKKTGKFNFSMDSQDPLYLTSDVDPLITGKLYEHREYTRPIYANQMSHSCHGLAEYGTEGIKVYDDGLPNTWSLPSRPNSLYKANNEGNMRDHYGSEGPTIYSKNMYSLSEPDHDPNIG